MEEDPQNTTKRIMRIRRKCPTGNYCSLCSNSGVKDQKAGVKRSYYRFPMKDEKRLKLWLHSIPRENWTPTSYTRICSDHFKGGIKTSDPGKPGFIPTIFTHVTSKKSKTKKSSVDHADHVDSAADRRSDSENMVHHSGIMSWLLYNTYTIDGAVTHMDDLYNMYTAHCHTTSNLVPVERSHVGRLIAKLFPTVQALRTPHSHALRHGRHDRISYIGLSLSAPGPVLPKKAATATATAGPALMIPRNCELDRTFLPDLKIRVPLPYVLNGQRVQAEVTVKAALLELHVHVHNKIINLSEIGFDEHFTPDMFDQKHLDAVIRMVRLLRPCRGCPWNAREYAAPPTCNVEEWSVPSGDIELNAVSVRIRANCCKQALPFLGHGETCKPCNKTLRLTRNTTQSDLPKCDTTHTEPILGEGSGQHQEAPMEGCEERDKDNQASMAVTRAPVLVPADLPQTLSAVIRSHLQDRLEMADVDLHGNVAVLLGNTVVEIDLDSVTMATKDVTEYMDGQAVEPHACNNQLLEAANLLPQTCNQSPEADNQLPQTDNQLPEAYNQPLERDNQQHYTATHHSRKIPSNIQRYISKKMSLAVRTKVKQNLKAQLSAKDVHRQTSLHSSSVVKKSGLPLKQSNIPCNREPTPDDCSPFKLVLPRSHLVEFDPSCIKVEKDDPTSDDVGTSQNEADWFPAQVKIEPGDEDADAEADCFPAKIKIEPGDEDEDVDAANSALLESLTADCRVKEEDTEAENASGLCVSQNEMIAPRPLVTAANADIRRHADASPVGLGTKAGVRLYSAGKSPQFAVLTSTGQSTHFPVADSTVQSPHHRGADPTVLWPQFMVTPKGLVRTNRPIQMPPATRVDRTMTQQLVPVPAVSSDPSVRNPESTVARSLQQPLPITTTTADPDAVPPRRKVPRMSGPRVKRVAHHPKQGDPGPKKLPTVQELLTKQRTIENPLLESSETVKRKEQIDVHVIRSSTRRVAVFPATKIKYSK